MFLSRWSFVSKAKPRKWNKVAVTSLRFCSLPACSSPARTDQNSWAVQPSFGCLRRVWAAGTGDGARNGGGREDSPICVTDQNIMEQQQVLLLVKLDWLWLPVCLTQVGKTVKLCPQDSPRCHGRGGGLEEPLPSWAPSPAIAATVLWMRWFQKPHKTSRLPLPNMQLSSHNKLQT